MDASDWPVVILLGERHSNVRALKILKMCARDFASRGFGYFLIEEPRNESPEEKKLLQDFWKGEKRNSLQHPPQNDNEWLQIYMQRQMEKLKRSMQASKIQIFPIDVDGETYKFIHEDRKKKPSYYDGYLCFTIPRNLTMAGYINRVVEEMMKGERPKKDILVFAGVGHVSAHFSYETPSVEDLIFAPRNNVLIDFLGDGGCSLNEEKISLLKGVEEARQEARERFVAAKGTDFSPDDKKFWMRFHESLACKNFDKTWRSAVEKFPALAELRAEDEETRQRYLKEWGVHGSPQATRNF